ncbi:MAG: LPS export ABC transporter ATP-binding protein [Planctomycetota bacterium]
MALLKADRLIKVYGKRTVVNGVTFEVYPGEIVGLLGPNGAGKTTSFRMTVGMVRPTGGKVYFKSTDITRMPMYQRARQGMGYLSQESSIFRRLTVEQNVMAIVEMEKVPRRDRRRVVEEALDELEIARLAKSRADTLSGGEKRRLEITRALVSHPSLLLLDEPFAGVDPIAVQDIQSIVTSLKERGIGVLLTDHNVRETLAITDRSYIIAHGQILKHGSPDELIHDPDVRRVYLGDSFSI